MGTLADQISNDCCGVLLGAAEKQILIAEVAELERKYELKKLEVVALEDEIVAINEQVEALCMRVFTKTYAGAEKPQVAWSQLCAELAK